MRKSQQKPVSEKRWTFDENEKPEKRLGDIREKFEHMIVDGPPVKNGMAQTVKRLPTMREIGVRSLGGEDPLKKEMATHSNTLAWKIPWEEPVTGFKSDVHHSGEDHNINHKIQVDNHGKIFEIHEKSAPGFKSQVLNVRVDQNRNSQNQGTGYKSHVLHSGVDQNRNVPNQGILGKKFAPQESSEKAPVKSDKGEQDIDKLQIKIDDLQKKIGDLLKKIDKGENDKYNLLKQIGDLVRKLDKAEQDRGKSQ